MAKTIEQQVREQRQMRQDQRNADEALLLALAAELPNEHHEKAGLIRAAELLRHTPVD